MRLKIETTKLLHEMGMPANLRGYEYLREAIVQCVREPGKVRKLTTKLYPDVSAVCNTTPSRAERAMRNAIETAFMRGDIEELHAVFGHTVRQDKGRPTVGEFVALAADTLRLRMEAGTWQS